MSCHSMTRHKAMTLLKKNEGYSPLLRENYEPKTYEDGSMGYLRSYYGAGSYSFQDDSYILERRYYYLLRSDTCLPFPRHEMLIGNHHAGRCEGRWYTCSDYRVSVVSKCRDKYEKYISKANRNKDTVDAVFYRVHKLETYKKGFLHGKFMCYDVDGNVIYTTEFKHGTGYYKHFDSIDNGIRSEGMYIDGIEEGKWIYYDTPPSKRDTFVHIYKKGVDITPK